MDDVGSLARKNFGTMTLDERVKFVQEKSHKACERVGAIIIKRLAEEGVEERIIRTLIAAFSAGYGAGAGFGVTGVDIGDQERLGFAAVLAIKSEWDRG